MQLYGCTSEKQNPFESTESQPSRFCSSLFDAEGMMVRTKQWSRAANIQVILWQLAVQIKF